MILGQKSCNQFLFLVRKLKHYCSCRAKHLALTFWWSSTNKITGTQHHQKLIFHSSCHVSRVLVVTKKSRTGKIQGRQQTTPRDNRCFNRKYSHSNSNYFSLPVIYFSPPFNNSFINPSQLSSVIQQSSRSLHSTPHDNQCFNINNSKSKSNELPSPVIPVPHPLNDSVINTNQHSSVR